MAGWQTEGDVLREDKAAMNRWASCRHAGRSELHKTATLSWFCSVCLSLQGLEYDSVWDSCKDYIFHKEQL
jgi:hypothetical protein